MKKWEEAWVGYGPGLEWHRTGTAQSGETGGPREKPSSEHSLAIVREEKFMPTSLQWQRWNRPTGS